MLKKQCFSEISSRAAKNIPRAVLMSMYISMVRIRLFEEETGCLVDKKEILCPCHLYIGQEATAVGVCSALNKGDYVFSTHRSHGHYIAKGGKINKLMAELYGRASGCSGGMGGSMHLTAPEAGFCGSTAIVGGDIPLGVGAALGFTLNKKNNVSVVFFGDGATTEGVLYESLNFAALKKLPVVFVCENNFYCTYLPISKIQAVSDLYKIGGLFGLTSLQVNGNNVVEVYNAAKKAVDNARKGAGPVFIEAFTYRWRGHVGPKWDLDKPIRTRDEVSKWVKNCPIKKLEEFLFKEKILSRRSKSKIYRKINYEIKEAVKFAKNSDSPCLRYKEKF